MINLQNDMFSAVEIEINSNCNMSCSYCPNSEYERIEQGEIDPLLFEEIMTQLKENNFKGRVSYHFYNEPLLSKNLNLFVSMTQKYLPSSTIVIYSNGTLLTKSRLLELFGLGVSAFLITKHEDVKKSYVFEKVYNSLEEEIQKRISYQGFEDVDLSNRAGLLEHIGQEDVSFVPCYIPSYLMVITLKGNVLPCYEDFNQSLAMGNVNDTKIIDIWNSEKYKNFRKVLKSKNGRKSNPTCENCSCVRF